MTKNPTPIAKTVTKKVIKAPPLKIEETQTRKIRLASHKSFKLSKKVRIRDSKLTPAKNTARAAYTLIKTHWRVLLGIVAVYAILDVILVRGLGGASVLSVKRTFISQGDTNNISLTANLFNYLVGNINASNGVNSGIYQTILIVITSLVIIWALRQLTAGKEVSIRRAFYNGTYPLIAFLLVIAVISVQMIPFITGSWLYTTVVSGGIAVNSAERVTALILTTLLSTLSFYMMTSSIFALYIVTLPDVTPMQALRSARQLVLHRRWTVLRKVLFLPFIILLLGGLIMTPFLVFLTPLADIVFFAIVVTAPLFIHSYMYLLYRQLL